MTELRQAFFGLGLKPSSWHGPGAAATAMIEKMRTRAHYGEDISATDVSEQQDWAHHAFLGGRIETLKQGYMKAGALYVYDIASAYPYPIRQYKRCFGVR